MIRSARLYPLQRYSQLALRCFSSLPIKENQSLYVWGTNSSGSLFDLETKVEVPTLIDWRSKLDVQDKSVTIQDCVCGPTDTAIVLSDGRCFVSGANKHGQLGLGHKNPVITPTLLPDIHVQKICLGPKSSALLDAQGEFYTFGYGGSIMDGMGQLGHGDGESVLTPKIVESLIEDGCCVQSFGVGEANTVVLTTEGEVLCTGAASHGRLGNYETNDQLWFDAVETMGSYVEQIAVGKSFALAIRSGVVSGWGRNHKGQLGVGFGMSTDVYAVAEVPAEVVSNELSDHLVSHIAAGNALSACITDTGRLYHWGMSMFLEPEYVHGILSDAVDVACGDNYWIALDKQGNVYTFGNGKAGVLGIPGAKKHAEATIVKSLSDKKVVSISAGWKHVAVVVEE